MKITDKEVYVFEHMVHCPYVMKNIDTWLLVRYLLRCKGVENETVRRIRDEVSFRTQNLVVSDEN